ncbi:unnamed protein product [Kluyveromyces dobzhanskii CBS 2104]|uniref:WGS project CCBQ000000000 data, contig 00058 n=1 Tax=Kluyveromyces dobzhanskii CBS 2104 TaxID=1427455 RepID=A0A0A8LBH5_9SACH|nr:unnamed protein product [Kluyveromyces dobzhanskii CBS 2104]
MLKLMPTLSLSARLSVLQVSNKKSFKLLDQRPMDVFQYYMQLQIDRLNIYVDSKDYRRHIPLVKRIRTEWESLSMTKRRVYHALFFKFNKLDLNKLANEELARYLAMPCPITSAYLLFRSKYKLQFNQLWEQKYMKSQATWSQGPTYLERHTPSLKITRHSNFKLDYMLNAHLRYQEMCKSCKKVWKDQVTDEQKQLLYNKVKSSKMEFNAQMQTERKELVLLTKVLESSVPESSLESLADSLSYHNFEQKKIFNNQSLTSFPYIFPKKN